MEFNIDTLRLMAEKGYSLNQAARTFKMSYDGPIRKLITDLGETELFVKFRKNGEKNKTIGKRIYASLN